LCAVAPGGEVMVSEQARDAAGRMAGVEWGERELHWLRNVSEPVATYLASSPEAASPAPPADANIRSRRRWRSLCPHARMREAPA
jgi:class 3 adenylate cyclase